MAKIQWIICHVLGLVEHPGSGSSINQISRYSFYDMYFYLSLQLSFQMWTNQIQETLNSKKQGDSAFRHKNASAAIDSYTQVSCFVTASLQKCQ